MVFIVAILTRHEQERKIAKTSRKDPSNSLFPCHIGSSSVLFGGSSIDDQALSPSNDEDVLAE